MSHHKRKDSKNRKHEASDGICPNRDTILKVMSYPCTSTWFSLKGYPQICHTSFSCTHVVSNGNLDVLGRPERPLAAKWSAHSYEGMWVGDSHFSQIAWWMEQNRISKLGRRWIPWSHQNSMANWYWLFFVMGLVRASHGFARIVTSEVVNILNMPWRFSPSCLRVCQVPVPSPTCGANHILEILNLIPKNQYPLVN